MNKEQINRFIEAMAEQGFIQKSDNESLPAITIMDLKTSLEHVESFLKAIPNPPKLHYKSLKKPYDIIDICYHESDLRENRNEVPVVIAECGRWFERAQEDMRFTDDKKQISCQHCVGALLKIGKLWDD